MSTAPVQFHRVSMRADVMNTEIMKPTNTPSAVRERDPRYGVVGAVEIRAVLRPHEQPKPIDVQLADMSNNGVQLRVFSCLSFDDVIGLQIVAGDLQFDLTATVKWIRPADERSWYVGCQIQPRLSEEAMTQLASIDLIDRRGGRRREIHFDATVCGQLERARCPATLRNMCEDGFGFTSPEPRVVGQHIRLQSANESGDDLEVTARVEWQLKAPDGYLCGCSFLNRDGYENLRAAVAAKALPGSNVLSRTVRLPRNSGIWIAVAVVVLFIIPSLLVISTRRFTPPDAPIARDVAVAIHHEGADESASVQSPAELIVVEPGVVQTELAEPALHPAKPEPALSDAELTKQLDAISFWLKHVSDTVVESPSTPNSSLANAADDAAAVAKQFGDAAPAAPEPTEEVALEMSEPSPSLTAVAARAENVSIATEHVSVEKPETSDSDVLAPPASAAESPFVFRAWRDATFRYQIVARVVDIQGDTVRLLKENGRYTSVPIARLSDEDQRFVERWFTIEPHGPNPRHADAAEIKTRDHRP